MGFRYPGRLSALLTLGNRRAPKGQCHLNLADLVEKADGQLMIVITAVSDVSLSIRENEIHAVIGPDGAGKSSPINLLSGDFAPTSGRVVLVHTILVGNDDVPGR